MTKETYFNILCILCNAQFKMYGCRYTILQMEPLTSLHTSPMTHLWMFHNSSIILLRCVSDIEVNKMSVSWSKHFLCYKQLIFSVRSIRICRVLRSTLFSLKADLALALFPKSYPSVVCAFFTYLTRNY